MADPIVLPVKRLPKQTLHHVSAPKLNRTVVLAGRDQLHLGVIVLLAQIDTPDDKTLNEIKKLREAARDTVR